MVEKLTTYIYRFTLAAEIYRLYVSICWLFEKSSERADVHVTNWLRVENNAMLKYSYILTRCVSVVRPIFSMMQHLVFNRPSQLCYARGAVAKKMPEIFGLNRLEP